MQPVYRNSGTVESSLEVHMANLKSSLGFPACDAGYVLCFAWSKVDYPFLTLDVEARGPGAEILRLKSDNATLKQLLTEFGRVLPEQLDKSRFAEVNAFQVGVVSPSATLVLKFSINTDHERFLARTSRLPENAWTLKLQVRCWPKTATPADGRSGGGPVHPQEFEVHLKPVTDMPRCDGFVAIDFGNTNSTIVCVDADAETVDGVQVLNADPAVGDRAMIVDDRPVASAVRLREYEKVTPGSDQRIPRAAWEFGEYARANGLGHLLLGAKRLLADPQQEVLLDDIALARGQTSIAKNLPAELLITSLFKVLYREMRCRSGVVATYPTTSSLEEIERLRKTITRAYCRSINSEKYRDDEDILARVVPLMIDEASAAAFYFLYRDFITRAGKTNVFHYLYPQGMNLLLFDCGGGTTDIALIHARPRRVLSPRKLDANGDRDGEYESWEVDIKVLGRTGHRDFGGDNITVQTFRVLKAELAVLLSQKAGGGGSLTWPQNPAQIADFLVRHKAAIDGLVPTCFSHLSKTGEEFRRRSEATVEFWNWCEKAKAWLGRSNAQEPSPELKQHESRALADLLRRANPRLPSDSDSLYTEVFKKLRDNLAQRRPYIDQLIQRDLSDCIDAANSMIRERLDRRTRTLRSNIDSPLDNADGGMPRDSVLHWVYVVGKASRYPLVREMIEQQLRMRGLPQRVPVRAAQSTGAGHAANRAPPTPPTPPTENVNESRCPYPTARAGVGRLRFDPSALKTSVAAGAALWRMMQKKGEQLRPNEDSDLAERLPFSISHQNLGRGPRPLFEENQRYAELTEKLVPIAGGDPDVGEQRVTLHRCWPGGKPTPFLDFKFPQPLQGPLWVWFDNQEKAFRMRDEGSGEEVRGIERAEREYVSPVQKGDL